MNLIQTLEQEEVARITKGKTVPSFDPGDTLRVNVKIKEGERERAQPRPGRAQRRHIVGLIDGIAEHGGFLGAQAQQVARGDDAADFAVLVLDAEMAQAEAAHAAERAIGWTSRHSTDRPR